MAGLTVIGTAGMDGTDGTDTLATLPQESFIGHTLLRIIMVMDGIMGGITVGTTDGITDGTTDGGKNKANHVLPLPKDVLMTIKC